MVVRAGVGREGRRRHIGHLKEAKANGNRLRELKIRSSLFLEISMA